MATRVAAEVMMDAVLIGRYFGNNSATSALSRAAASAGTIPAPSRGNLTVAEGDGPGVRTMAASSGASAAVGMSTVGAVGPGPVRFMSMFGRKRAEDPVMAELIARSF
ncbi:hypothetical protein Vretimale_8376 [Volvox reticuliferus]|uniref:Uncharacterized protein n=1 Tax=Volvox reticuliferus TaxID=1737510 RepID=A0A8J4LN78_9CHLO|nr:hypothetical protein Vretifemale_11784 [Volvox reticuliferus]GIM03710.1 hypothetical protein Vretimale_8376 [Volvox reticuliferus]